MTSEFDKLVGVGELSQADRDLVKRLACDFFSRECRGAFAPDLSDVKSTRITVIMCLKEALAVVKAVSPVFRELETALEPS